MSEDPRNTNELSREEGHATDTGLEQTDVLPPTAMVGGKYRLGRLIGEGGMGAVYEAEHTGLQVRVAVKLLNEVFVTDPSAMSRFRREARAAAAIRHPNIVEVTDTGQDEEGVPFIVMELLEGESLSALLRREKFLTPVTAATVCTQILNGLGAAHAKDVIHRDLKPGNILLARQPNGTIHVKILDFGISKIHSEVTQDVTAIGAVIGTPRFMAPEQARGQSDLDHRVDLYAVGVLLYRMVTGKLPFAAKSHEEIINHILSGTLKTPREVRPDLSEDIERIILKAMASDREDRYQTAQEFLNALHEALPEVTSGTVTITSHTGTNTPTPLSLQTSGGSIVAVGPLTQQTREASPKALRARRRSRVGVVLALLLLATAGVAAGSYVLWGGDNGGSSTAPDAGATYTGPPLRMGITKYLPERQLLKEHAPLREYLARRLQRPVVVKVHEDYVDLSSKLASGRIELAALSSYAYVRSKRRWPGMKAIATHVTSGGTSYEGYIVTKANTGIKDIKDLKGKVFCYVGPNSSSGFLYPRAVFRQRGMDPDTAFRSTRFTGDHLSALRALEGGACHGAAVFAGIFFEAEKHGMPPQGFRILASTARIPYDAYCVPPSMSKQSVHSLREALLALKPGLKQTTSILGAKSRIVGFAEAKDSDWDSVRQIEKFLDTHPPTKPSKDHE